MRAGRVRRAVLALAAAIITLAVGVGVGLAVITFGLGGSQVALVPTASPGPTGASSPGLPASPVPSDVATSPAPRPSVTAVPGVVLTMPITGDCLACHTTPGGGVGSVAVPPIGHPLEGWTSCTSCHSNDSLVKTAPGHVGIHADQCLLCHKATTPAAESRPHSIHQEVPCLTCHGTKAPLPESMRNRSETTCWLCHQGSSKAAPLYLHPTPADGACLTCHVAGKVGALPADHAGRTNDQCSSCHSPASSPAPNAPHELANREGMCTFCHGASGRQ